MNKEQNCKDVTRKKNEKKQNGEITDFLQLLQNNGMFVDCVHSSFQRNAHFALAV